MNLVVHQPFIVQDSARNYFHTSGKLERNDFSQALGSEIQAEKTDSRPAAEKEPEKVSQKPEVGKEEKKTATDTNVAKLPKDEEIVEENSEKQTIEPAILEEPAFVDLEQLRKDLGITDAAKTVEKIELDAPKAILPESFNNKKLEDLTEKPTLLGKNRLKKQEISSPEDQKLAMNGEIERILHNSEKVVEKGNDQVGEIPTENEGENPLLEKETELIAKNEEIPQIPVKTLEEKIFVQDLRTVNSDESKKVLVGAKDEKETFTKEISVEPDGTTKMVLTLNDDAKPVPNVASKDNVGATQRNFGQMLTAEIKQSADAFVKAGMISLKDGNSGSINLVLRPEMLGDVKISLDLSDNLLTGKIVVATQEAYNAFKENLDLLKQGFNSQGFDTQNFDLSWSGSQTANSEGNNDGKAGTAALVTKTFSRNMTFEDEAISVNTGFSSYSSSKVNIIA